jgi:ribose-phosphate pyrophosphokinase
MAGEIGKLPLKSPLILAPDEGAASLAEEIARTGGWETDYLQKIRLGGDEVRIEPKNIPVAARDVVIVDDIISTGGTQATAAAMLYNQGAAAIHTVCVHGVMANGAYSRLIKSGFCGVFSSDTIESGCSSYSAAGTIAQQIRNPE